MGCDPTARERFTAPFPWFGGKRAVSAEVWRRFGVVANYVEPFAGSLAVLLGRPGWAPGSGWIETVNDKDGFISNCWRSIAADPDAVLHWTDWPVNENDLHARHAWLLERRDELVSRLEGDPDYFDAKIAGWGLWGICIWIGGEFCSGNGPWQIVIDDDGARKLVLGNTGTGRGIRRRIVHLSDTGMGVRRQRVHLGDTAMGVYRRRVHLGSTGVGVHRKRVYQNASECTSGTQDGDGNGSRGMERWIYALANRLERVRVCSGDWSRICGHSPTDNIGITGVFLDPPYSVADRDPLYRVEDFDVAHVVRQWCLENGNNPKLRIAMCGYDTEHGELDETGWQRFAWSAGGGYSNLGNGKGRDNRHREVIWFSPHCLPVGRMEQLSLFQEAR